MTSLIYLPLDEPGGVHILNNASTMGHNSDKMYVTHSEHAAGAHTASSGGKRAETGRSEVMRLPL